MMKHETAAGGIVYRILQSHRQPAVQILKSVRWLICQHSQHKGWVFPKGLVGDTQEGESYEEAALREVEEEGGVKAGIVQKIPGVFDYIYTFKSERIKKTVHYFLMEYLSGDPKDHDWEMQDAKFITEEEIRKLLTYPSERKAFDRAVKLYENRDLGMSS